MAARGSGKVCPVGARCGLLLTEVLIGLVIFIILSAALVFSCADIKALYVDRQSDENIGAEVRSLQRWLEGLLYRAVTDRMDFELFASQSAPSAAIKLRWKGSSAEWEVWRGDECAVKAESSGGSTGSFFYNHLTQTLTPALEFACYIKKGSSWALTKWRVSLSPYGYVRVYKTGE